MTEQNSDWPHDCKTCAKVVEKEDAIDIGPDKSGWALDWFGCPVCGNSFVKHKQDNQDETK